LKKAGFTVPNIEESGGITNVMGTPFHADRLGVLYTRTFSELKGITKAMDQLISRTLTQGIADGDNPVLLARKLVSVINGAGADRLGMKDSLGRWIPGRRRAEIMARTEIIRAHHQATIQEYRNWGAEGVVVQAEWQTAGDERVCATCASMQGEVYKLDVIQNMIPIHAQCRCLALPYRPGRDEAQTWDEMPAVKS
jgi:SPP1 gp7 family putative phage head morphogenesis protein